MCDVWRAQSVYVGRGGSPGDLKDIKSLLETGALFLLFVLLFCFRYDFMLLSLQALGIAPFGIVIMTKEPYSVYPLLLFSFSVFVACR